MLGAFPKLKLQQTLDSAGADIVVHRDRLDLPQEPSCFRLENRNTIVRPSKPFYRFQRIKEVHYHELNLLRSVTAPNITTSVPFDSPQAGKHFVLQQVSRMRPRLALPSNLANDVRS